MKIKQINYPDNSQLNLCLSINDKELDRTFGIILSYVKGTGKLEFKKTSETYTFNWKKFKIFGESYSVQILLDKCNSHFDLLVSCKLPEQETSNLLENVLDELNPELSETALENLKELQNRGLISQKIGYA